MSKQLDYDDVDIDEYNPDEEGLNINSDLTEDFAEDCCVKAEGRDVSEPCFPLRRYADAH